MRQFLIRWSVEDINGIFHQGYTEVEAETEDDAIELLETVYAPDMEETDIFWVERVYEGKSNASG